VVDLLRQAHLAAMAITITGCETAVQEAWNRGQGLKRDLMPLVHALLLADRQV
jgi:hypothetical protein